MDINTCVVHVQSVFTHFIYMVFFQFVQTFSLFLFFLRHSLCPLYSPVFNIWLEYPELLLLFLIACMCSLYLVWNVRPVCPMYFRGHSIHLIWYTPLFSYPCICGCGFTMFCTVFLVRNAIFICASLKSFVIFYVYFPLYVKTIRKHNSFLIYNL
jgi:hypothetical protein